MREEDLPIEFCRFNVAERDGDTERDKERQRVREIEKDRQRE